jgi:hypothetical protein
MMSPMPSNFKAIEGCGRPHYEKSLRGYAAIYTVSHNVVYNWIRRGEQTGDCPPLDNRAAMWLWVRKHYGTRAHAPYTRQLKHFAAQHDVSIKAIGDWIRRGKEIGHMPPLGWPGPMARCFRRYYAPTGALCPFSRRIRGDAWRRYANNQADGALRENSARPPAFR